MDIEIQELNKKLGAKEDFVFLDVREPHEYEEYNMNAQNIPLGEFPNRIGDFEDKDAEIVIHCRSGARSAAAQAMMQAQGYKNVRNLIGGAMAYQEKYG